MQFLVDMRFNFCLSKAYFECEILTKLKKSLGFETITSFEINFFGGDFCSVFDSQLVWM